MQQKAGTMRYEMLGTGIEKRNQAQSNKVIGTLLLMAEFLPIS
ncbi:MAG: hypothetical protein ABSF81_04275 [Bacteroidales bacterium]|jgi:hypothetical protein